MSEDKVKITLNGEELEVEKGTTLLDAATQQGKDVPIFCYHEGLESSGYCRMCLVEVDTPRGKRLITSCNTPCTDGTVCDTHSERAIEGRESVLEFLLINHPLDCPECDKAGECMLQNNSYDHGKAHSRMDFKDKLIKPYKELGDKIRLYSQRCIACRRCTQFLDQVSGTSELAFHERGDHQELDIFPGLPVENTLAKNIVDICPVGALIDKDFQYTTRQWMMEPVNTVCAGCAKVCAVEADAVDESVKRFKGRHDEAVNGHWICDHGRDLAGHYNNNRHIDALIDGKSATGNEALSRAISLLGQGDVLLLASAFNTQEEIETALKICGGQAAGALAQADGEAETFPGFTIPADKNPNRAGVIKLIPGAFDSKAVSEKVKGASTVLVLNATMNPELGEGLLEALRSVKSVVLLEAFRSPLADLATVVLPSASPVEKKGTFVNESGIDRDLRFCQPGPGSARMDGDWLSEIRKALVKVGV